MARSYAKKNGFTVRASAPKDGDTVVLQFTKATQVVGTVKPAEKPKARKSA